MNSIEQLLYMDPVGEAMFLGEMLMGIDLDGEEPGDDSKCMLIYWIAYGVGLCYVCIYTRSGFVGRKQFCSG